MLAEVPFLKFQTLSLTVYFPGIFPYRYFIAVLQLKELIII